MANGDDTLSITADCYSVAAADAALLHLLTSGHSVGRLPNRNGAGRGDDQRQHGRAAGLLHLLTSRPCWETTARQARRTRRRSWPTGRARTRTSSQPTKSPRRWWRPLSRRPGHGNGLEHRSRAAQLLQHRTSRRPPCGQARSHGGSLGAANSSALSGRRRGRRGGGRHRRADPGPHGRLTVKLDGPPQQRLQRVVLATHTEPVEHCAHLQLDPGLRAPLRLPLPARHGLQLRGVHVRGQQRLRPIVRQLRGRPGCLEHGQDVLHSAAKWSGEAALRGALPGAGPPQPHGRNGGRLRPPDPGRNPGGRQHGGGGGHGGLLKHEFLDRGADDVTLATLGEVLLEPTLTTLGNFLVRSNSSVASASFTVGGFQLEGYAMTLSAFAWSIVRTYTLTPGRRYSFGCRYRLGTASNLVMYVSAADNDYVGVTGTFLGTASQGVWSTARPSAISPSIASAISPSIASAISPSIASTSTISPSVFTFRCSMILSGYGSSNCLECVELILRTASYQTCQALIAPLAQTGQLSPRPPLKEDIKNARPACVHASFGRQLRQSWEKGVRHLRHLRHPLNVEQKCLRRVSDLSQQ